MRLCQAASLSQELSSVQWVLYNYGFRYIRCSQHEIYTKNVMEVQPMAEILHARFHLTYFMQNITAKIEITSTKQNMRL